MQVLPKISLSKSQMKALLARILDREGNIKPEAVMRGSEVMDPNPRLMGLEQIGLEDVSANPSFRGSQFPPSIEAAMNSRIRVPFSDVQATRDAGQFPPDFARTNTGVNMYPYAPPRIWPGRSAPPESTWGRTQTENPAVQNTIEEYANRLGELRSNNPPSAGVRPIWGNPVTTDFPILKDTPSPLDEILPLLKGEPKVSIRGRLHEPQGENVPPKVHEMPIEQARQFWKDELAKGNPLNLSPVETYTPKYMRYSKDLNQELIKYHPITPMSEQLAERKAAKARELMGTQVPKAIEDVSQIWDYMTEGKGNRSAISKTWKVLLSGASGIKQKIKTAEEYFTWCYGKFNSDPEMLQRWYPREFKIIHQVDHEMKGSGAPYAEPSPLLPKTIKR